MRADLDSVLLPGETLTEFVEASVGRAVEFRRVQQAMRAYEAVEALRTAADRHLATTPYSDGKVGRRPTLREPIVPFGSTGYVLRFDIRTPVLVVVIGARHRREEDFH